ncbi:MAG: hypothetical protein QOJ35_2682 [Solirubrobacteraceae bacterium]|nr:hypothetical protein [Solirubrobacteraceae bacterium]
MLAVAALALSSCGGGEAAPTPAQAAAAKRLTSAQFAQLQRVYVAQVGFDARTSRHATAAAAYRHAGPLLRACGALDDADVLLLTQRSACAATARLLRYGARAYRCSGPDSCETEFRELRSVVRSAVGPNRAADRAVRATGLSRACKRVLVTSSSSYASVHRLDAALTRLLRAIAAQSRRGVLAAAAALRRVGGGAPTAKRDLRHLRASCRPR